MNRVLLPFWRSLNQPARLRFARRCDTTVNHLQNIAYGLKRCGESLCINIERESNAEVRCEDLRPDVDWGYLRSIGAKKKG
jgi:DNA-binding transcriptional regulator YdaS (Cro superfamily)